MTQREANWIEAGLLCPVCSRRTIRVTGQFTNPSFSQDRLADFGEADPVEIQQSCDCDFNSRHTAHLKQVAAKRAGQRAREQIIEDRIARQYESGRR